MGEKLSTTGTIPIPLLVKTGGEARAAIEAARASGKRVGLVPTMGALHEGHLSLVRASMAECRFTAVTIFVNRTQFDPNEDFQEYPRDLSQDLEALGQCGVDLVFAPHEREMYPEGFSTHVEPPQVSQPMEGRCRPGHFRGVATVVLKLFQFTPADVAYFGQKDYQQSLVVRRMVEDFNLPIEVRVCPIVRDTDGLAMSSRNAYLSPAERQQAIALWRSLTRAADLVQRGETDASVILSEMRQVLGNAEIDRIDYVALVDPRTLADTPSLDRPAMALVAAYVGETRLIDNLLIEKA